LEDYDMAKTENKDELPSNSRANRTAPIRPDTEGNDPKAIRPGRDKHIVPVSKGQVIRTKKTIPQSIASALMGETMRNLSGYIMGEVIVPTAKSLIEDIIKNTLDQVLYGGENHRPSSRNTESKVSYGSYYNKRTNDRRELRTRAGRAGNFNLDEVFFKRMPEASDVLSAMCDLLEDYDEVTVADYFDLAGVEGATWTHNKWGWKDLKPAYCTHTRNGYAIVLPEPVELD
jgi:hypothetical protein